MYVYETGASKIAACEMHAVEMRACEKHAYKDVSRRDAGLLRDMSTRETRPRDVL